MEETTAWHVMTSAFTQLAAQSPVLLVYFAAILAAGFLWRRSNAAATLLLAGALIMLISSIVGTFAWTYLIELRAQQGWEPQFSTMLTVFGIVRSILHAAGLALIVASALIGRSSTPPE